MGNYKAIWEWIYANYDVQNYLSAEDLLYDVESQFNRDGRYFPPEASDLVKERFQYRQAYIEMQKKEDEAKQISEFIGSGELPISISDQIVEDLRRPEIMDVDISDLVGQRPEPVPQDIVNFANRQNFFTRIASGFKRLFRWR